MTKWELVQKLKAMREAAKHGHLTAMTQVFGIIFDKEIEDSGSNAAEIAREAGIRNAEVQINDGRKLARCYVTAKPELQGRWRCQGK